MATINPARRSLLLAGIEDAAKIARKAQATLDNLIVGAAKHGVTQTDAARAAGVSQAHISRTLAANRKLIEERKARRASKRKHEGGTV